jgi:hypothetical protein
MNEIQISVGASLDISPTSNPFLIGKYALSDIGDKSNSQQAYLGDYEYNEGEQLGDIILASSAFYGKGKVLVFGDTSSFQNPVIPFSYPLVGGVFNWLKSDRTSTDKYIQTASILILSLFVILYLFKINIKGRKFSTLLIIILIIFSMYISHQVINPNIITKDKIEGNIAYIDVSHQERLNQDSYEENSINGLINNLMRNNYLPLVLRHFSSEDIKNSDILILNAPTNKFSDNEIDEITSYINDGGFVILATGHPDKDASDELINNFQLNILNIPLGPVPYTEDDPEKYQESPRFVDSWPIIIGNTETTESFYKINLSGEEYTLITFTSYGKGGFLLIGDSEFLYDKNIETLYTLWPGNLELIKNILDNIKEKGVLQ